MLTNISASPDARRGRRGRHFPGTLLVCSMLVFPVSTSAGCSYYERGFDLDDRSQTTAEKLLVNAYAPENRKQELKQLQNDLARLKKEAPERRGDLDFLDEYAYVLFRNGHDKEARQIWEEILEKEPGRFRTLANSGTAYQSWGKMDEAAKRIGAAAKLRPDFRHGAEPLHVRMIDYQQKQRADPEYSSSHLFVDELSPLWFNRKGIEPMGKFPVDVSSNGIAELLREFPGFGDGWVVLGMALENEGDAFHALAAYRRALKQGTSHRLRLERFVKEFEETAARDNPARRMARRVFWAVAMVVGAIIFLFLFRFGLDMWSDVREAREKKGEGGGTGR